MSKKKWVVTIAVSVALLAALGTTVAFAADGDEWIRGFGRRTEDGERAPYNKEWIDGLVEDGTLTQEQADSILAGDARLYDFVSPEDCDPIGMFGEYGGYGRTEDGFMYSKEYLEDLVKDGVITQDQADSILAGQARLYEFVDPEDCPTYEDGEFTGGALGRNADNMPRGGGRGGRRNP